MKVHFIIHFTLLSICCTNLFATTVNLDSLLHQLDMYIENSHRYTEQKEAQIADLRKQLSHVQDSNTLYRLNIDLFNEYKSYKYDSAFHYAFHSLRIAQKLNHKRYEVEAYNSIVFCLLSSGLFKEAFDIVSKIDLSHAGKAEKTCYYAQCSRLYYDIADYNHESIFQNDYLRKGGLYTDSILALVPEKSDDWWYAVGQRQMKEYQYDACIKSFEQLLTNKDLDPHTEAIITSSIGWIYSYQDNPLLARAYLARAAINDIKSAIKETTALCVLANLLYQDGDINRATRYIRLAMGDANFYNARHRKLEIGSILPIIEKDRFDIMKRQRNLLLLGTSLFLLLVISLSISIIIIYKKVKKLRIARQTIEKRNLQLQQTNGQLVEANKIKDEYIGNSFYLNAEYIDKIEDLAKLVNRKITAKQFEDLRLLFKESTLNKERDNMYASFDETFLKLFPTFIRQYNDLFPPQYRSENENKLTSEMRIFALIRLGITESERIAKFLNYSVHTINTYKTRVKNKSLVSNETFEQKIMSFSANFHQDQANEKKADKSYTIPLHPNPV